MNMSLINEDKQLCLFGSNQMASALFAAEESVSCQEFTGASFRAESGNLQSCRGAEC